MIYLDYAATNPFIKYPCNQYGQFLNPNANYAYKEQKLLDDCANRVKTAIGAKGGKVVFGGTASQLVENLECVMDGVGNSSSVIHWDIGSAYEHDSVDRFLTNNNLKTLDDLERKLVTFKKYDRPVVFWQGVNNVTGRVFNVEKIGSLCHKYNAFFICDMTAMIGHAPISANIDDWCDCAFWSGHKIGTELSIGAMWLSTKFNDWLGNFKLHGTPNVAGALAIADATEDAVRSVDDNMWKWRNLAELMGGELNKSDILVQGVYLGIEADRTHAINAIRFNGINADALQQYLASKRIYVGLGASACAEAHNYRVLNAFDLSDQEASEVIRVSFGENSTVNNVFNLVEGIKEFKERFVR